jgi:hypothetical protein
MFGLDHIEPRIPQQTYQLRAQRWVAVGHQHTHPFRAFEQSAFG